MVLATEINKIYKNYKLVNFVETIINHNLTNFNQLNLIKNLSLLELIK